MRDVDVVFIMQIYFLLTVSRLRKIQYYILERNDSLPEQRT